MLEFLDVGYIGRRLLDLNRENGRGSFVRVGLFFVSRFNYSRMQN